MTTRTISINADHIAALVAMRSTIGDAANHPGRAAAIAALDHLATAPCSTSCVCRECMASCWDNSDAVTLGAIGGQSQGWMTDGIASIRDRADLPWSLLPVGAPQPLAYSMTMTSDGHVTSTTAPEGGSISFGADGMLTITRPPTTPADVEIVERATTPEPLPVGRAPKPEQISELRKRLGALDRSSQEIIDACEPGCSHCGNRLMFAARQRGDWLCGPCRRDAEVK